MHLPDLKKCYLIDSNFWNAWKNYVGWQGIERKDSQPKDIELDIKPLPGCKKKLSSSLSYLSDFDIIPEK